jgi:hypothetical protein
MDLFYNNPYRLIGIYAGAPEREYQSQKSKLNAFMRAGKELVLEHDFMFLPELVRDSVSIDSAFSKLQINKNKLYYSIFWFTKGNHVDKTAFKYLEEGLPLKAVDIWKEVSEKQKLSPNNISSFINLSTLQLALGLKSKITNIAISDAFRDKCRILRSEEFYDFARLVTDENYIPEKDEILRRYVDDVSCFYIAHEAEFEQASKSIYKKVSFVFTGSAETTKEYAKQKMIAVPMSSIENEIADTTKKRQDDPFHAVQFVDNLTANTSKEWSVINSRFKDEYTVGQLSDEMALEILYCGIDFFVAHINDVHRDVTVDGEKLIGESTLYVYRIAERFAIKDGTKQHIADRILYVEKWLSEVEDNISYTKIQYELKEIDRLNKKYLDGRDKERREVKIDTVQQADEYWQEIKLHLGTVEQKLGQRNIVAVDLCSSVISRLTTQLIRYINICIQVIEGRKDYQLMRGKNSFLIEVFSYANDIMEDSLKYSLNEEVRKYVADNLSVIKKSLGLNQPEKTSFLQKVLEFFTEL